MRTIHLWPCAVGRSSAPQDGIDAQLIAIRAVQFAIVVLLLPALPIVVVMTVAGSLFLAFVRWCVPSDAPLRDETGNTRASTASSCRKDGPGAWGGAFRTRPR